MPNSLRCKLSKLRFQGKITQDEYKDLIKKLEGHDEAITAQIKWERDTAINQLKQLGYGLGAKIEPCEDCISRKAALDEIDKYIDKAQNTGTRDDFISFQELVVKQLPSVKPQRPKGKWIEEKGEYGVWSCSECKELFILTEGTPMDNEYHYCPNCGAEMEGDNE